MNEKWKCNAQSLKCMAYRSDGGFTEVHRMTGHNNFVSCVCVLPPSDSYPNGVIVTGSNDKNIHGYTLESATPVFKLTGHTGTGAEIYICSIYFPLSSILTFKNG